MFKQNFSSTQLVYCGDCKLEYCEAALIVGAALSFAEILSLVGVTRYEWSTAFSKVSMQYF